ncbi:hypothetical protein T492DRAFT_1091857, partial [Pavlovales sp. CCMP2436]
SGMFFLRAAAHCGALRTRGLVVVVLVTCPHPCLRRRPRRRRLPALLKGRGTRIDLATTAARSFLPASGAATLAAAACFRLALILVMRCLDVSRLRTVTMSASTSWLTISCLFKVQQAAFCTLSRLTTTLLTAVEHLDAYLPMPTAWRAWQAAASSSCLLPPFCLRPSPWRRGIPWS